MIVNYDEIPASLASLMSNGTTLEHRGTKNVMTALDEKHFKRMGTLVTSNATGVINFVHMCDHYIPNLVHQLKQACTQALIIMDSASSHISPLVLAAFRAADLKYAIIPRGLTMFIQSIDVALALALASFYPEEHHKSYAQLIEDKGKLIAAQIRNSFVRLCYLGYMATVKRVNVPQLFKDLGCLNPADVKLRVPFQFAPPVEVALPVAAPKPKPKAAPKQLSMAYFLKKN